MEGEYNRENKEKRKDENPENEENRIENSEIENSVIENSEIKDSEIKDSHVEDRRIEESKVEDSRIEDSRIDGERIIGGEVRADTERVDREEVRHENLRPREETHIEEKRRDEGRLFDERKDKVIKFLRGSQIWVIGILIIAVILGVYIRSLPMQDHGGNPGLWDITTNTWTLGPDLDPWLFLRSAKTMVEQGSLPRMDMMRNVPLGFDNTYENPLLSYMIAYTYYFFTFIGFDVPVEFAGAILPVIMFGLTIISFFLFVREVFVRKSRDSKIRANIISLISTFLMIVVPIFLSRTVAGIPEKESAGFFFLFLAFYLFLKGWKSEKLNIAIIFGVLAGIATGMMGLIWGGFTYIMVPIGLASLIAFILNKVRKKEFIVYSLWVLVSIFVIVFFSNKYSLMSMFTSISSGSAFVVFLIMVMHFLVWNTKIAEIRILRESKLPQTMITFILSLVVLLIVGSILFGPSFIIEKVKAVHQLIFKPTIGRWNITVAENRQPYFDEWKGNFGPFIKNIPLMFWLFFMGSVVLFKKMMDRIKQKDAWILTGLYVLFFFGIVFSRYSGSSVFNGENFISKSFYYGSVLLFFGFSVYYYIEHYKKEDKRFEEIDYEFLLLFALFMFTLITVRGAVRLIMVLGPIAPIFIGFLVVWSIDKFRKTKDETYRIILGVVVILIVLASVFTFWTFYNSIKGQAYGFVPSHYNQQWQKAMDWTRNETPKDAVFGHWWDYGYWVQSIGNRATVLDGGNAIGYWNYLMGRLVLTGDNQEDALDFLYNHNTTHFLIDSTDIGKYGAFSSIGSNKEFDRYSWIGTYILDEKQTQETQNQTLYVYAGGTALDEDLIIEEGGQEILLPGQGAGVGAILLPIKNVENGTTFGHPYIIVFYQGRQHKINLRYLSVSGEFVDFGSGIEACVYVFPKLGQEGQGISRNPIGAAMFISPRLFRGMLSQIYILEDPLNKYPNFKLAHTEQNLIVESLNSQGMDLPDFVFYNGIQGPIKIWEIEYTGNEVGNNPEYLDKNYWNWIDWRL